MKADRAGLRLGNLLLAFSCLALAGLIYLQLDGDLSARPAPADRPKAKLSEIKRAQTRAAEGDIFRPAPVGAYDGIVDRPLFHRTRRPIAVADEPRSGAADKRLPLYLAGVVVDAGGMAAFLKVKDAPRMVRVRQGGAIEGWTVEEIGVDSVTLMKKGKTTRLSTKDARPVSNAARGTAKVTPKALPGNQERPRRKQNENRD